MTSSTHPGTVFDGLPTLSVEQQTRIFEKHQGTAWPLLYAVLNHHAEFITDLALERLVTSGFAEYGDAMFHQSQRELLRETFEELSDALNRCVALSRRVVEADV